MKKTIYSIGIHLLLIAAIVFGVKQCQIADNKTRELVRKENIFNKANEIVKITVDADSNTIVGSKPQEETLSQMATDVKNLVDSASQVLNLPKNERIVYYNKINIQDQINIKAKEVNSEYAYAENENWYSRYNFRDSIFDLRYKTVYQNAVTTKDNKILGITYKKPDYTQYDWFKGKTIEQPKPTSVIIKDDSKSKTKVKFQASNVNKFRSMDNSVMSGVGSELTINRVGVGGQYLYNFNTQKPEYEVTVKFNLFK